LPSSCSDGSLLLVLLLGFVVQVKAGAHFVRAENAQARLIQHATTMTWTCTHACVSIYRSYARPYVDVVRGPVRCCFAATGRPEKSAISNGRSKSRSRVRLDRFTDTKIINFDHVSVSVLGIPAARRIIFLLIFFFFSFNHR
jgi:hypothetical protein